MRMLYTLLAALCLCFASPLLGQLADGSEAPDFVLTDINGNTHHLYDLLDAGKTVVLDFSATWCGPCWNYHNTHAMRDFYEDHGPNGSDESMVFFIESDLNTGMADLMGNTPGTQGNWIEGTPYPIIDLQTAEVSNAYNINFFPTIYKVCSDKKIYEIGQAPATTLSNWIQSCTFAVELDAITHTNCYGEEEGQVSLNVSGGFGQPSYAWSNGTHLPTLNDVEAGSYGATVTDDNGRSEVITNIVVEGPEEPIEVVSLDILDVDCFGDASGSITVEAVGGNGVTGYAWSNGDIGPETSELPAGFYTVTITDAEGCESQASYEVIEPDVLEIEGSSETAHCGNANGSIIYNLFGGTPPYFVESAAGVVNQQTQVVSDLPAGTHEILAVDALGCEVSFTATVDDAPGPVLFLENASVLTCLSPNATLTANIDYEAGELSYTWIGPDGIINGEDQPFLEVTEPGVYTLIAEDLVNGCEAEDFAEVQADIDLPALTLAESATLDCENEILDIIADVGQADGLEIAWNTPDGNIITPADQSTISVDAPGEYTITASNPDNGCSSTATITIADERSYPQADFNFTTDELLATFTSEATGDNIDHAWDFGDGNSSNAENPEHTYAISGWYTVCLTVANACDESTECFEVLVEAEASVLQVGFSVTHTSCADSKDGEIVLTVIGGNTPYTFDWIGPDGFNAAEEAIWDLKPGTYTVLVEDADGVQVQLQIAVEAPDALEHQVQVSSDLMGYEINLEVGGGTAPYTYAWNNGEITEDLRFARAGTYVCVVTDANGCTFETEPITVGSSDITPDIERPSQSDAERVQVLSFPNQPLRINIPGADPTDKFRFAVTAVNGAMIAADTWFGDRHDANIAGQPSGIYFVAIFDNSGWLATEKIFISE